MAARSSNSPSVDGPGLDTALQERLVAPPSADEPDLYAEAQARAEPGDTPPASTKVPWDIGAAQPHVVALDGGYDTLLSSALYHSLPKDARSAYAAATHRVSNPGARLHLLSFADDLPESYPLDSGITRDGLRTTFGGHWRIDRIEWVYYHTSFTPETLGSVGSALTSRGGSETGSERGIHWRCSEEGHLQLKMWHLQATRK